MLSSTPSALANAAETRRREMPAAVALVILTGGLSAAIMGGVGPVEWAAVMALMLIADMKIYQRLDRADTPIQGPLLWALTAWALLSSAFYATLPAELWLSGEAAGAAAAMVLWVAGVVRCVSGGSGATPIAIAGAAPPALSLLIAPFAMAYASRQPDWGLAIIAAVGGGALMAYVAQARISAAEAEQSLRKTLASENLQHTLAQLLFDESALAAFLVDREGRVVTMSNRMVENWKLSDVAGRRFEQVCPWSPDRWRDAFRRALQGEHVRTAEDEVVTPNGRRWLEWQARPWRGSEGEIRGVLAFGRNITPLVEARREAEANQERLRVALDAGRSVVWEADFKHKSVTWCGDAAAIYGADMTFEEFKVAAMPQLFDEDREIVREDYEAALAGKIESFEHRLRKPNGDIAWVQVWVRAVRTPSGVLRAVIGLSKDVTERKREEESILAAMMRAERTVRAKRALLTDPSAEHAGELGAQELGGNVDLTDMFARLDNLLDEMEVRDELLAETLASLRDTREAAEKASVSKSQFLTSMSHELRTPLNAIIGYSEILMEEAEADGRESDQKDIDRVLAAARQLLHLINDILDLSKIEAGRMDVSLSEFDVASLIHEATAIVRPAIEKNANFLSVDIEGDLGDARSDPFKLNQCLLNLLSNAGKFTEKGKIAVHAWRERDAAGADWIQIEVRDTGIGMTAEQVSRLFNAYVQADTSTARKYGGTGLGLAITRRVMQMLGGDVTCASAPSAGSVFTLRFPARIGAAVAAKPDLLSGAQAGTGRIVLVIDDEESARDLVARSLTRLGFDVHQASNGQAGLEMAAALKPSVILLDLNLPDVSGWNVLAQLRAAPETANAPVIIHSVEDNRPRALASGASEHLLKPADRDVLAAAVARIVRPQPLDVQKAAPTIPLAKTG